MCFIIQAHAIASNLRVQGNVNVYPQGHIGHAPTSNARNCCTVTGRRKVYWSGHEGAEIEGTLANLHAND